MDNNIHPTAIIHPSCEIGSNNYIGPYCVFGPNCMIGFGNRFESHVSISSPPEHRDCFHSEDHKGIRIGSNNIFREFVTVNGGWMNPTTVGDYCVFLRGSHAGHDAVVHNNVNISCNVLIGGHTIIHERANIGLAAVIHQRLVIGALAMVGMNSTVTRDVVPFSKTFGNPAQNMGINMVGLSKHGISDLDKISLWNSQYDSWIKMRTDENRPNSDLPPYLRTFVEKWEMDRKAMY